MPAARIAVILSGTGSAREYIQRLGRVLRKGKDKDKFALLYEVVAEDTSEEGTSVRRRGLEKKRNELPRREGREGREKVRQLEIVPAEKTIYALDNNVNVARRAAEQEGKYSVQNLKSKIQNQDVANRSADAPPKWGGDCSEAVED